MIVAARPASAAGQASARALGIAQALTLLLWLLAAPSCKQPTEFSEAHDAIVEMELINHGGCEGMRPPLWWQVKFSRGGQATLDEYTTGSLQQWVRDLEPGQWDALTQTAEIVDWSRIKTNYFGGISGPQVYSLRIVRARGEQTIKGIQEVFPATIGSLVRDISQLKSDGEWTPRE